MYTKIFYLLLHIRKNDGKIALMKVVFGDNTQTNARKKQTPYLNIVRLHGFLPVRISGDLQARPDVLVCLRSVLQDGTGMC